MTRPLNRFQRILCWLGICPWTIAKNSDMDADGRFPWFCQRCHKIVYMDETDD